jgi:hypothetical protein
MNTKSYIYESPDKGKTVFRREFGETQRELVCRKCTVGSYVEIIPGTYTCTTCGHELDKIEFVVMAGMR